MQFSEDGPRPRRILTLDIDLGAFPALPGETIEEGRFDALDAAWLARLSPDQVIVPLISAGQDATTVIERLQDLGYQGAIIVICPPLPNPRMVEHELRALGPGARLTLVIP